MLLPCHTQTVPQHAHDMPVNLIHMTMFVFCSMTGVNVCIAVMSALLQHCALPCIKLSHLVDYTNGLVANEMKVIKHHADCHQLYMITFCLS